MLSIAALKVGTKIKLNGEPFRVVASQFSKTGRQGGVMAVKIKNLRTGNVLAKTFQGSEKIEEAEVYLNKAQFLFHDAEGYHFMHTENYEQFTLATEALGESGQFLKDGMECDLLYFEDQPINVNLPPKMNFEVLETPPGVKGDTASGGTKEAKLDCGIKVQVPLFIKEGDEVRVNTETLEYVERV